MVVGMNSEALDSLLLCARDPFDVARVEEGHSPVSAGVLVRAMIDKADADVKSGWTVNVLDMPIKLPYGSLRIPEFIPDWARVVTYQALEFESYHVGEVSPWHVYLTVHQSMVEAQDTQRNGGAHIDGMQGVAYPSPLVGCHAYLLSSVAPTVFYPHAFTLGDFDRDRDNLYSILDRGKDKSRAWTPAPGELMAASCYCVHEAGVMTETGPRSFIRVEFSKKRFDRVENTRNPLIDTSSWQYRPRPIPAHLR
jgi:hypothetical protein